MAINSVNSFSSVAAPKLAVNPAPQPRTTNEAVALPTETFQSAATQMQPATSPVAEVEIPSNTSPQAELQVAEPKSSAPATMTSNFGTLVQTASNGALVEFAPTEGVGDNLEVSQQPPVDQPAWMDSWFEVAQAQKAQAEIDNKLYTTGNPDNPDQPAWMDSMADLVRRPR